MNNKQKILLVEDDFQLRDVLLELLAEHFDVIAVDNGECALEAARNDIPDLILLDLNIPKVDGLEVCRRLRLSPLTERVPVLILTGNLDCEIRVSAFELGADDFLQKPFYTRELLSRIRARLRRAESTPPNALLKYGSLELNLRRMEVVVGDRTTPLSPLGCALLSVFLNKPEAVLSRDMIMSKVWGDTKVSQRTVDTHIVTIRKAIERSGCKIESVYGAGYLLTESGRRFSPTKILKRA